MSNPTITTIAPAADLCIVDSQNHFDLGQQFFAQHFAGTDGPTLIHHRKAWRHWVGSHYATVSDGDLEALIWKSLPSCKEKKGDELVPLKPKSSLVSATMSGLKAVAHVSSTIEQPCWLTDGPSNVIAFQNGLLDLDDFQASGDCNLRPHTPQWFSANCLPHDLKPFASCPNWLKFLSDIFDGDGERISALQQWFGYCLTNDNSQQKAAILIGPPRSGKGTTISVLSAVLGHENVASLSLEDLGGQFGLHPLVGKLAAIVDEAQLGRFGSQSQVLRTLKTITGGASQTINRKNVDSLSNVRLNARFTLTMNELPRLPDASAALVSRFLVIPYLNSYVGKEDTRLLDRLLAEVSGITTWALHGLQQLNANGGFVQPSVGQSALDDFEELSSPTKVFVRECCVVGDGKTMSLAEAEVAWKTWCQANSHEVGKLHDLGRKLRAVVPRVKTSREQTLGVVMRSYCGIGLSEAYRDYLELRSVLPTTKPVQLARDYSEAHGQPDFDTFTAMNSFDF